MSDDDVWFEPKLYGYGAGLPVTWQGWALIATYGAALIVLSFAVRPQHPALFAALVAILTVPLLLLCARHTRGGWRWRWGARN